MKAMKPKWFQGAMVNILVQLSLTSHPQLKGKVPLIGVGGVSSGADAYAKIKAGASLVQLYTALIYQGPGLVTQIKRDLVKLLQQDGHTRIGQAVGTG